MKKSRAMVKAEGALYFSIPFLATLAAYLLSDQSIEPRLVMGVILAALGNGLVSLKAYFSQSLSQEEKRPEHIRSSPSKVRAFARKVVAAVKPMEESPNEENKKE